MLRNQEKNSIFRGIFLIGGWGLGLDRFYERDKKGGIINNRVGYNIFLGLSFLNVQDMNMLME